MTEEELTIAVRAVEEYAVMIDRIQQESDRLKTAMKEYMRTNGLTELEVDGQHIRLQEIQQSRLDIKTLKKAQPDLYREYCRQIEVTRLIIS